jgi:hypothetical protein
LLRKIHEKRYPELLSLPARTCSGQPESSAEKLLLLTYQEGRPPNQENGAAYIARSVSFQHLMWRDSSWFVARPSPHYHAAIRAVTRHEFTLALAHKACFRCSGSQHHLIMAIAHGTHAIARGMALHSWDYPVPSIVLANKEITQKASEISLLSILQLVVAQNRSLPI